jgi:hypothetical protein
MIAAAEDAVWGGRWPNSTSSFGWKNTGAIFSIILVRMKGSPAWSPSVHTHIRIKSAN